MERIKSLRRPPPALIKLIECIGILLALPKSFRKSVFKAPIPSNYDSTLDTLAEDFYGKLSYLSEIQSGDIDNDVAADFYGKMLEPGVDYEDAVNAGGLVVRELFNVALIVLLKLQADPVRLPVNIHHILTVVDGTRAAYIALDTAEHICKHGTLNILLHTNKMEFIEYLEKDMIRRCKLHYKLPDYRYQLHTSNTYVARENDDNLTLDLNHTLPTAATTAVETCATANHCASVVIPYPEGVCFRFLPVDSNQHWAVRVFSGDVIFTQNNSYVRPFTEIACARTFIVYVESNLEAVSTMVKALRYFRPGDSIVVLAIFPSAAPVGDSRLLRFDFGARQQWLKSDEELKQEPSRAGWNDEAVQLFTDSMDDLIRQSFLTGKVRIERAASRKSSAEVLCAAAREEKANGIMMQLKGNEDALNECLVDQPFSVFILK